MNKAVYIIHYIGGEYEDRYDNVVGVFEDEDIALNEIARLNLENDKHKKNISKAIDVSEGIVKLEDSGLSEEECEMYMREMSWLWDDSYYGLRVIKMNEINREGEKDYEVYKEACRN
jgi:hypothetical protein